MRDLHVFSHNVQDNDVAKEHEQDKQKTRSNSHHFIDAVYKGNVAVRKKFVAKSKISLKVLSKGPKIGHQSRF